MLIDLATAEDLWDKERWPNFVPRELCCKCGCGSVWWDESYFDAIQGTRSEFGPIRLNCAHRCPIHNAKVGGAPKSQHKKIAFDISLRGMSDEDKERLNIALINNELVTRGSYRSFVHVDARRPPRWWIAKGGKANSRFFPRVR